METPLEGTRTGVEADAEQAVSWYVLAALRGSKTARKNLRLMFEDGLASQEDLAAAAIDSTGLQRPSAEQYLVQVNASSNKQALQQFTDEFLDAVRPRPQIVL